MSLITIRSWDINDAEWLGEHFNNINIWNNLRDYIPHPYTQEDADKFITAQEGIEPALNFVIMYEGNRAGGIGITAREDIYRMNVELGYWISETLWGKDIATEAVAQISDYIFEKFAVNRIVAEVFEYNKPSMRVLEKNGFFLENVSRKGILKNEYLWDNYIWVKQKIY